MTAPAKAPVWTGFCNVGRHHACRGVAGHPCPCDCHQQPEPITVHCFFGCPHVAQEPTPEDAHAAMELHYFEAHREQIRAAVGWAA